MQIEKMKLADLKPAVYNPRVKLEPGMDEYEKLKKSLQEFGFVDPPIFNKQTGNLVGGHQRVTVAQKIALCDEIEVSVVDLSLEKEKALNLALNKISGKWDDTKLALLLKEFEKDELDFTGFDQTEADDLINQFEYNLEVEQKVIEDEFDIEQSVETIKQNEPKTNYGDVWQLGSHRLMCGDATITIHVYVKNKSETEVYSRTHKAMTDFSDKVNKTVSLNMNGVLDGGQNTGWIQFLEVFNDNLQTTLDDDANG